MKKPLATLVTLLLVCSIGGAAEASGCFFGGDTDDAAWPIAVRPKDPDDTRSAEQVLADAAPYAEYIRSAYPEEGYDLEKLLTEPADLDRDGYPERLYRLGEEGLLFLRLRDGQVEAACPSVDFRGYGAKSAEIVKMQGSDWPYILLHMEGAAYFQGFWLMRLQDGLYEFVEYSTSDIPGDRDAMVDADQDGAHDGYWCERNGVAVLGYPTVNRYVWDGQSFHLNEQHVSLGAYPAEIEGVVREFLMLTYLDRGLSKEIDERLLALQGGKKIEIVTSWLDDLPDAVYAQGGYALRVEATRDDGSNTGTAFAHFTLDGAPKMTWTFSLVADNGVWVIDGILEPG